MAKRPSIDEQFKEFAATENAVAIRGGLLKRSMGEPGDTEVDQTRMTLRELLCADILVQLQAIIQQEQLDQVRTAVESSVESAMEVASDIVRKEDPDLVSMLDATTLGRTTDADIDQFLRSLGRDPSNERHATYIQNVMRRAITYFDKNIGSDRTTVHANLSNTSMDGVRNLFKAAAGKDRRILVPQACALLRIMAMINFIEADPALSLLPQVNDALQAFRDTHIKKKTKGEGFIFHTGHPTDAAVQVLSADIRSKTDDSTITKLLIKPSNRTEEVMDHVGVRFITRTPRDVLKLIHMMFFHTNAPLPLINIIVNRGKNKMVDTTEIESIIFEEDDDSATKTFNQLSQPMERDDDNPHSLAGYKAIHITFDMPIETADGKVKSFPVEFQFLYMEAHEHNELIAPHERYKNGQQDVATRRAMGSNLKTAFEAQYNSKKKRR